MPQVVAYEDAKAGQARHKGRALNTWFIKSSEKTPDKPVAFLTQRDLNTPIRPHWHIVDQFQVIAGGSGTLGKHPVSAYCVHFSRAYTPYGPIKDDGKNAVAFFTLRAHYDPGSNYMPDTKDKLRQIAGRSPWQVSVQAQFASAESATEAGGSKIIELPGIRDERGLFGATICIAPGARATAPHPGNGDGQYLLIVKGGLLYQGREHKSYTIVHVGPHEGPFELMAGGEGLEALILNFPRAGTRIPSVNATTPAGQSKTWQCELCAFAYNEAPGLPQEGLPPGTRWEDVPHDWTCPDCAAAKSDFRMVEQ